MPETIKHLEFYAPIKTVSEANSREHWGAKAKRKKSQREEIYFEWKRAAGSGKVALPCVVRLTRIAPKALDAGDNLSSAFKAIRDEIAKILGVDDGGEQVSWEYDQVPIGEHRYNVKVEVRPRPVE
jgi:hypothetical protein